MEGGAEEGEGGFGGEEVHGFFGVGGLDDGVFMWKEEIGIKDKVPREKKEGKDGSALGAGAEVGACRRPWRSR